MIYSSRNHYSYTQGEKYVEFKKNIKWLIASFLTATSFFISFKTPSPYESHISSRLINFIFEFLEQFRGVFAGNAFMIFIITLTLCFAYSIILGGKTFFSTISFASVKGEKLLALFFSIMYTGGKAFEYNDSLSSIWSPKFNIVKTLILLVGVYYLYLSFVRITFSIFENKDRIKSPSISFSFYHSHPFLFMWIFISLMWLPHLILRYPGALSEDNYDQLNQFFGFMPMRTNQPVIHTVTVGAFVNFGLKVLGSANVGLFIYCFVQALSMAAVLSYSLLFMKNWNTPKWFRLIVVFLYTATPYFTGNAAWAIKDYPHMVGFVLWGLVFIKIVVEKKFLFSFKHDKYLILLWTIGAFLMSSYRKNGLHIYLVTVIVWMIIFIINLFKKRTNARLTLALLIMLIAPILISSVIERAIINSYSAIEIKQKDAFSLPFQQTARYYHYYGDELTQEEHEAIGDILDYEWLYTDYHPECSDSVKEEFHAENTSQILRYLKVWFLMFFKHPICYIEATWNQSYYIFMPGFDNVVYNQDVNTGIAVATDELKEYLNLHIPTSMEGFAITVCSFYRMLNTFPVIAQLNNLCIYVFLMFTLSLFLEKKELSWYRLSLLPLWLSFLFIFLAPMIVDQPRYSWAIFYLMPTIVAMYMHLIETSKSSNII